MNRLALIGAATTFAVGLVLAFVLTGCGSDDAVAVGEAPTAPASEPAETSDTATTATTAEETEPVQTVSYRIWLVDGDRLTSVRRTHVATQRVGTAALEDLLAGPTADEAAKGLTTEIPEDTRLLGLVVSGRVATVDLSSEFESGAGTTSMTARLAQVTCTLDAFPTVDGVRFELDGEPVEVFSAEGIVLDHPVACGDYDSLVLDQQPPAIAVTSPAPGSRIQSGTVVKGNANVFEANVSYLVVANEHVYAKGFTTATCGTGCRGTFSFRLRFHVDEPTEATLVVHDDDAADTGSPPHVVRIPVTLLPS
ncbi:MAG TPA: GerMN domain-containing protein [Gaiellaceae bacterium]